MCQPERVLKASESSELPWAAEVSFSARRSGRATILQLTVNGGAWAGCAEGRLPSPLCGRDGLFLALINLCCLHSYSRCVFGMVLIQSHASEIQGLIKGWTLGCVIPRPGFFWPGGEFTQPKAHLFYHPCTRITKFILVLSLGLDSTASLQSALERREMLCSALSAS